MTGKVIIQPSDHERAQIAHIHQQLWATANRKYFALHTLATLEALIMSTTSQIFTYLEQIYAYKFTNKMDLV